MSRKLYTVYNVANKKSPGELKRLFDGLKRLLEIVPLSNRDLSADNGFHFPEHHPELGNGIFLI